MMSDAKIHCEDVQNFHLTLLEMDHTIYGFDVHASA
jgi:hypothetical protein